MTVKMTYFIQTNTYGFSESFYLAGTPSRAAVQNLALSYCFFRKFLMGPQSAINYVRFSYLSPPQLQGTKSSWVSPIASIQGQGTFNSDSDCEFTRVLCQCYDTTGTRLKNWFMGGVPDSLITTGGTFSGNPAWNKAFTDLVNFMTNTSFGWYGAASRAAGIVTNVVSGPTGQAQFTLDPTTPIFAGLPVNYRTRVRNLGIGGSANLNVSLTVVVKSPTTAWSERRIAIFPYTGGGTMNFNALTVIPIARADTTRAVERKGGRPSYQSRGRAGRRVLG